MKDNLQNDNCCFPNQIQPSPCFGQLSSFLNEINRIGSFNLLCLIASASSFGIIGFWQQAAHAETDLFGGISENGETLIAKLDSIDNKNSASTTILVNGASETSDLGHNRSVPLSQPNFSFNLQQKSIDIPQLPSLAVNTLHQEKLVNSIYTVKAGDTIAKIARRHGISSKQIIRANGLANPNLITVNRRLIIPAQEFTKSFARNVAVKKRKYSLNNNFISQESPKRISLNFSKSPKPNRSSLPSKLLTNIQDTTDISKSNDRYISKLRQDIVKLRSEYQQQLTGDQAEASQTRGREKTLTPVEKVNLNQPQPISVDNSVDFVPSSKRVSNTLVSAFKNFALLPELPPLAAPEEYLPNNPIAKGYVWPAQGNLTSGYGWRWGRLHKGIDIAAPIGTPIVAAAPGKVIFAGWNTGGYGNLVKLEHDDGSVTLYAHNDRLLISSGQQVKQGQLIAEMGSTGRSSGPHLHFEIRPNGSSAINPIARLPKK